MITIKNRRSTNKTHRIYPSKQGKPLLKKTFPNRYFRKAPKLGYLEPSLEKYRIHISRIKPGLGDILMLTPALRGLREKFPNAYIVLTVRRKYSLDSRENSKYNIIYEAVKDLPFVNKVDALEDRDNDEKFDFEADVSSAAGELREEQRGTKPRERVDIFASYLDVKPSIKRPYLSVKDEEKQWAIDKLNSINPVKDKKIILICQNSNTAFRDLPIETTKRLVAKLSRYPNLYVCITSELYLDNWNIPNTVELRGLKPREFFGLVAASDMVVTPDTGTIQVAGALNKRMIALWGPTHPLSRTSYLKNVTNIWHPGKCNIAPCWYSSLGCKNRICMTSIKEDEIIKAILDRLEVPYDT